MYDYVESIKDDLNNVVIPNIDLSQDRDVLYDEIFEIAWVDDDVTGNGSALGYTGGDEDEVLEYLKGNLGLLKDAIKELSLPEDLNFITMDTTIRCYLLPQAINEILDEKGIK